MTAAYDTCSPTDGAHDAELHKDQELGPVGAAQLKVRFLSMRAASQDFPTEAVCHDIGRHL